MGTVDPSSAGADIRGRVGGTVSSSNAQAHYVKAFVPPTQSRTPARQEQRRIFKLLSQAYAALDWVPRAAWMSCAADPAYARFDWWGNPYQLTGGQLFISVASDLLRVGLPVPTSPPDGASPPSPPTLTAELHHSRSALPSSISWDHPWAPGLDYTLIDVCYSRSPNPIVPPAPLSPFLHLTSASPHTTDITALMLSRWGLLPLNYTLFAQARPLTTDGRTGVGISYLWRVTP